MSALGFRTHAHKCEICHSSMYSIPFHCLQTPSGFLARERDVLLGFTIADVPVTH